MTRRRDLDGIRGVAIFGVLAFHGAKLAGGHLGVVMFFVLSGYLITRLLLGEHDRTGTLDPRHFYLRRAARLLPALILMLIGYLILARSLGNGRGTVIANVSSALFYYRDILIAYLHHPMGTLGFTWTLAIEEQFYLLWPLILGIALWRRRLSIAASIATAGVLFATLDRVVTAPRGITWYSGHGDPGLIWFDRVYYGPAERMDALFLGCLLALALHAWPHQLRTHEATLFGLAALATLGVAYHQANVFVTTTMTVWTTVAALATVVLIYSLVVSSGGLISALLSLAPVVYLGRISYGVYLWNSLLAVDLERHFRLSVDRSDAIWISASVVIASLSYHLVERPILDRVPPPRPRRRKRLTAPQPVAAPATDGP